MNRQNIDELAEKIRCVGFEGVLPYLVRRICFRPERFVLSRSLQKGNDIAFFHFCIQHQKEKDYYILDFYDTALQKEAPLEGEIDGIDIVLLEQRMKEIDWKGIFHSGDAEVNPTAEKAMWAEAEAIEGVICDITRLAAGKGADAALRIKQKFWASTEYQEFTGTTLPGKVKDEISQRFFLYEEHIISADEAFRFLQNRWLEKELQAKWRSEKHSERNAQDGTGKHRHSGDFRRKRKKRGSVSETGKQ